MKKSPQMQKLEEMLRSSRLVAGGFMGDDARSVEEVIDADTAAVEKLGFSLDAISERMRRITDLAKTGLGTWVVVDDKRRAMVLGVKGALVCPWPHGGSCRKTVTTVELIESGRSICWSDLSVHLIGEHGFFEGRGSRFRIEPKELIKIIF